MPYISTTFVSSYTSSQKTLRIVNSGGSIVFTINVCNYQKSSVVGNNLNVILADDTQPYILDFSSNAEALQALLFFKQGIDTLILNCPDITSSGGGGGGVDVNPIPISYLEYKSLQQAANLIAFQWYDVTDSTGLLLSSGTTIRMQPVSIDDFHPEGIVLDATQAKISISSLTDSILFYELPQAQVTLINSSVLAQNIDAGSCSNILVKNGSTLTAQNSDYIEVENNSVANLLNCQSIKITGQSNVTLSDAIAVSIHDINQDFTAIPFVLRDVEINPSSTIGKLGRATINSNSTLNAYYSLIEQTFFASGSNGNFIVILQNQVNFTNSEFRIQYTTGGSGNKIVVKNIDTSVIYTLTDAQLGNWAIFRFNLNTSLYEFVGLETAGGSLGYVYYVTSPTANQTTFSLPIPATNPVDLEMFINGQKKVVSLDFTYDGSIQSALYLNRDFVIDTTDEIEFIIY